MPLSDELLLAEALLRREDLVDRTLERDRTEAAYYKAIRNLHEFGLPLRSIAKEVRLSHQRVHQIVSNPTRTLERQRRKALPFRSRGTAWGFSGGASVAIEHAERAAREHGDGSIDVQHLLLGVVLVADGPLADGLARLGLDESCVRAIVAHADRVGEPIAANRPMPIAAPARVAAELARREADHRHSKQMLLEHLLLGIALVGDARAEGFVRDAGLTADRLRAAILP